MMKSLDIAKQKLDLCLKDYEKLILEIKDFYDLDNDYDSVESIEDAIDSEEFSIDWQERREFDYACDMVRCQQMLVDALKLVECGENANKEFETLIHEARKAKKEREQDIIKAQQVISLLEEILSECDTHRNK